MSDAQVQRTYWETSRVEKRRSTLGRGVSAPVAQHKGGARKKPMRNARSEDAQHHRQEQQQRKPAQQDALKLVPKNTYSQQAPWANGSRNVTGSRMKSAPRMAPLLGPIHASARLQDESEGDLPCYRLGAVLPRFGRAQSPPRRHPETSARATAALRCVTPDPFRDAESRSTLRSPSPMQLDGNDRPAARQNKDPAQPQQRRPWTAVRESEGLTLEQEVRVRSRTVNSICRDIERRRHAARQQLKIRDLTERVQTQAKASMDREIEMREHLAREFPNFPIPLQKSWELALERRSQGPLGFKDPGGMEEAEGGMPPAPRFRDESSNTTEEPLYLRYLRAKKYH